MIVSQQCSGCRIIIRYLCNIKKEEKISLTTCFCLKFNQSWNDIGYSFAAGGDNRIYTGRGWSAVGAHAPGYNNQSIGICVIGDWTGKL